jgi:crotonobetainyl-CoA:carnitine CoA-transferase CaiB-like acyl-CoA transferase
MLHAALECRSERYVKINGAAPADPRDNIAGLYRCADGWVRLHTNFPHHRDGVLALLQCQHDREAVAAALQNWRATEFEQAASDRGLVVAALRRFEQWDDHPQAAAISALPLFSIERVGEAPPLVLPTGARPLEGIRVLDLTRVIAGPVCGRTLAAHGADVLAISAAHLPSIEPLVMDTGRGKRSGRLDLRQEADRTRLATLVGNAHVFVQGYRPGGLDERGFSPQALAQRQPGIVYVSLSAYGHAGPWAGKRGFDSLVQTATGFNHAEAQAAQREAPQALPMQILDHASGYLMALGAIAALHRRMTEGGSWLVRVSLAQTAAWVRNLGRVDNGFDCAEPAIDALESLFETGPSGFGDMTALRHAAHLSATPARWTLPSVPLGTHPASW